MLLQHLLCLRPGVGRSVLLPRVLRWLLCWWPRLLLRLDVSPLDLHSGRLLLVHHLAVLGLLVLVLVHLAVLLRRRLLLLPCLLVWLPQRLLLLLQLLPLLLLFVQRGLELLLEMLLALQLLLLQGAAAAAMRTAADSTISRRAGRPLGRSRTWP